MSLHLFLNWYDILETYVKGVTKFYHIIFIN